jgi:hypothetical protein
VTVLAGVAHLLVWARRTAWSASVGAVSVSLATQKMEQLRSLAWSVDVAGARVSDVSTNMATDPADGTGSGLQPSPAEALTRNTPGFVDYLDAAGRWCGTGARPPGQAAFVRRWAIEPFPPDPADTLLLTVVVMGISDAGPGAVAGTRIARLQTLRPRVLQ